MPKWGGVWSSSWGSIEDQIMHLIGDMLSPGVLRLRGYPMGKYRSKFLAPFINGIYQGSNIEVPLTGPITECFALTPGTVVGSIYLEDAGDFAAFDDYVPNGYAEVSETETANRLQLSWTTTYELTRPIGDSQVSVTSITGAKRGVNVGAVEFCPTRGSLTYSINKIDDDVIVRWYADAQLVAEGSTAVVSIPGGGNLISAGSDFGSVFWGLTNVVVTTDTTTDADGGTLADTFAENTANANHVATQFVGGAVIGARHSISIYGKQNTQRYIQIAAVDGQNAQAAFDLQNGVVTYESADVLSTSIESAGNGWWKCTMVFAPTSTTPHIRVYLSSLGDGTTSYLGTSKSVYLYKFELFTAPYETAAITCTEMNGSGLEMIGEINYTADLAPNISYVEMRWPSAYEVHYSTSALSYPRTAQFTVTDTGSESYIYLSPILANGTYNIGIVEIDDNQIKQTAAIPNLSRTVNAAPLPPSIVSISGTAAALTVTWTVGEAGCTFDVYTSLINEPVNFESYALPAKITTALNATSAVLAAVTGYAATSKQTAIDTLFAAFDAAVVACNADFNQTDFAAAFETMQAALIDAVIAYGDSINLRLTKFVDAINLTANTLAEYNDSLPVMSASIWEDIVGGAYGEFLAYLGGMLNLTPGRYTLPNGAIGAGALGSEALGTGAANDGSAGVTDTVFGQSLYGVADPIIETGKIRVVVRATKAGVQEKQDHAFEVEFDDAGAIITARPNEAHIQNIEKDGLDITVSASVIGDDAAAVAAYIDLYVVPSGDTIDLTSPSASSSALPSPRLNVQSKDITYTVPSDGYYDVAVAARTGTAYSARSAIKTVYMNTVAPGAVGNFIAKVIRGRGARSG